MQRRKRRVGESFREQTKESRHKRNVLIAWSLLLVTIGLGILVFFIWSWLRPQMSQGPVLADAEGAGILQKHNVSAFESPSEGVALELVKQALALRDPAEVERYFRIGSAEPAAVIGFLEGMETVDGAVTGFQWLSSMDANGMLLDGVLVSTSKDETPRNRLALLTPDEKGAWKIDFEAFARTVKPSWDELLAEDGGGRGVMRVIVARDSYYNGPFRDDNEWESYGMASPDSDTILLGYCRKDSPQARAMARIFSEDNSTVNQRLNRATLELRRPEGAELRQFEISRVLAEDWVLADEPFDAAFE
jgi:hypothetical protein